MQKLINCHSGKKVWKLKEHYIEQYLQDEKKFIFLNKHQLAFLEPEYIVKDADRLDVMPTQQYLSAQKQPKSLSFIKTLG